MIKKRFNEIYAKYGGIYIDDITEEDHIIHKEIKWISSMLNTYYNNKKVCIITPEGLKNTVMRMAMDLYRHENIGSEGNSSGSVSSIKEGDTTVSYTNLHSEFKDTILKDYSKQLNKYRKMSFR